MRPGWEAGAVRAQLLANRRLGREGARAIAASDSLETAVAIVAASPYGHDVRPGMSMIEAQRGIRATTLWHLRVLAGWLPPGASEVVRVLAGGHEIANLEAHLDELAGAPPVPPFGLGALTTAWPRLQGVHSIAEVRGVLARSQWGDPGTEERAALTAALRLAWARRVSDRIPELRPWAMPGAALVVAAERFGHRRALSRPASLEAGRLVGPASTAVSLEALVAGLPGPARAIFADVVDAGDIWRAEAALWRALGDRAVRGTRTPVAGRSVVAWSGVSLLVDARRVCAALESVAWGAAGVEAFDALG